MERDLFLISYPSKASTYTHIKNYLKKMKLKNTLKSPIFTIKFNKQKDCQIPAKFLSVYSQCLYLCHCHPETLQGQAAGCELHLK